MATQRNRKGPLHPELLPREAPKESGHIFPGGGIYRQMQDTDDISLLRQYVDRDSQDAFATLVSRHVNKVYSIGWRLPHYAPCPLSFRSSAALAHFMK